MSPSPAVLKDIINRYKALRGFKARRPRSFPVSRETHALGPQVSYIPGWDCHGLPIELKVLQSLSSGERAALTPVALRSAAAAFANATVAAQKAAFRRFGVWGDWEAPYLTLQPAYEAAQLSVFGRMFLGGHIYRGLKPVNWSPSSRTALAEAELEYPEGHTSRSVYLSFPLLTLPPGCTPEAAHALDGAALAVWTTTAWTLPANAAVAVNPSLSYSVAAVVAGDDASAPPVPASLLGRKLVVASARVGALASALGLAPSQLVVAGEPMRGSQLEGATYSHPLASLGGEYADRVSPVVAGGDYITDDAGTGLVHTAPGHGQEDYATGLKHGLPLRSPVDDAGKFTPEAGGSLSGLPVLTEGAAACIAASAATGALLAERQYAHKYPYDWRTKKPTIFRATEQWFASVDTFRDAALEAAHGVAWFPPGGAKRMAPMIAGRTDWCISRQRAWGVPIPVFYHADGSPLLDEATLAHVTALVAERGSDCWWALGDAELLPPVHRHLAGSLRKGTDTMDVWFDSGSSWAGVLAARGLPLPADLYLEGSDQHRGWFQSSLLTSVAATGAAPFKAVLTHGFVLDEKGAKMSKSLGNVVDPARVICGDPGNATKHPAYGADVLRLWVASTDYTGDVLIGDAVLKQTAEAYRKQRGTLRYLLGNLHDFDAATQSVAWAHLPQLDRLALRRLAALHSEVTAAYDAFAFGRATAALNTFTVAFLSALYLDTAKDRLYVRALDSPSRRACQTVLHATLRVLGAALAPVTPHMAEEAHGAAHPSASASGDSVFASGWPSIPAAWSEADAASDATWEALLAVRAEVNKLVEAARGDKLLGASLEARVVVHIGDAALHTQLVTGGWAPEAGAGGGDAADAEARGNGGGDDDDDDPHGTDELRYLFIVSRAEIGTEEQAAALGEEGAGGRVARSTLPNGAPLVIGLARAGGAKCERCWNYSPLVGRAEGRAGVLRPYPSLCGRCASVAAEAGLPDERSLKAAVAAAAAATVDAPQPVGV